MTAADPAYVLKTYHGEQHEQHYQHEVQAFSRLLQNPSSIEHVVKCYATFKHGETYNLIMQWVSGGDLLEYFRNTPPPQTSEEIADFWGSLTKVMIGLPPIHQTTVPGEHSDEYQLVHQDIKPDNILVDPSPGPGLYQFNPIVADLGHSYTRHIKTDTSDIPAVDRRGNQTYCAPESSHHAGFRRTGPNRITSDADIFSAGAVFSDAASWVANGHDGRQEYAKRRHDCLVKEQGFVGYETGFHNGVERLRCVDEIHRDIRSNVSSHDKLTPRILDIVEEHMLSLPNYRLRASLLCGKFEQEILHAKAELPAALQDGEPSRRPNTPPEPSVTLPKLYTQPTIGKPNRIRSETEYRLSMADATAYCDAKKAKRSVDPKVESTVEELGKSLGKRDYLFFIDDTDSMKEYAPQIENAFRTLAYIAKSMDPDSLELSFVSDPLPVSKSGHTSPLVDKVKKCRYTAFPGQIESSLRTVILEKIIKHLPSTLPVVGNILRRGKPITIFVFTDGKWGDGIALGSGLDTPIRNLMNEVKKRWLNRTHVMFQFLRFGDNEEGIRHLEYLDQFGREEMWLVTPQAYH
jgi:serine/threonine protein kinase